MSDIFSFELSSERLSTVDIQLNEEYNASVYFMSNIFSDGWTLTVKGKLKEMLIKADVYLHDSYSLCCTKIVRSLKDVSSIDLRMIPAGSIYGRYALIFIIYIVPQKRLSNILGNPTHNLPHASNNSTSPKERLSTVKKLDGLSAAMKKLIEGDHCDVTLCVKSKKFRAHKIILSARSVVFAAMFQQPMKESLEGRVDISDISPEIMKEVLTFIYTGVVTLKNMSMARYVYAAAHKYQLEDLQAACTNYMKNVTLDSVVETLQLANLYDENFLKQTAFNFISRHYLLVKVRPDWIQFMNEHQNLALEALSYAMEAKESKK